MYGFDLLISALALVSSVMAEPVHVTHDIVIDVPASGVAGIVVVVDVGDGVEDKDLGDTDCNGILDSLDMVVLFRAMMSNGVVANCAAALMFSPVIVRVDIPNFGFTGFEIAPDGLHAQIEAIDVREIINAGDDPTVIGSFTVEMPVMGLVPYVVRSIRFDDDDPATGPLPEFLDVGFLR